MEMQNGSSHISEIFFALCKSVDSPVSLGAWLRFKHNQLALAQMEINPRDYLDAETFKFDYCVVSFLSKWKGLDTGLDLEAEALSKFTTSEFSCREANERIRDSRKKAIDAFTASVLFTAQRKIARVLGPFSLFKVENKFGWGPGATDDVPRRRAAVDTKLCELPISVTPKARDLFLSVLANDLHWSSRVLEVAVEDISGPYCFLRNVVSETECCVIDTVPKNAKTHRVIAKEPRANGFLQKGAGGWIRKRLKLVGVDLDDQVRNQLGASRAYVDRLATLDLKAASDSMSVELVYELLPFDWADFLDTVRSPKALLPSGSMITLEKFSSMGNGFTFELESLIFWAITASVRDLLGNEEEVLVYGDDIICSANISAEVVSTLAFIGFTTNKDKSFVDGDFYESCGRHYFKGTDVTPIYQKEVIGFDSETIRCGNRILRLAHRFGRGYVAHERLSPAWHAAWRRAGPTRRFQLPFGASGDDGWVLPATHFAPRPQDVNLGIRCEVITPSIKRLPACDRSLLAWALRRGSSVENSIFGGREAAREGSLEFPTTTTVSSFRWVMPGGEFDLKV